MIFQNDDVVEYTSDRTGVKSNYYVRKVAAHAVFLESLIPGETRMLRVPETSLTLVHRKKQELYEGKQFYDKKSSTGEREESAAKRELYEGREFLGAETQDSICENSLVRIPIVAKRTSACSVVMQRGRFSSEVGFEFEYNIDDYPYLAQREDGATLSGEDLRVLVQAVFEADPELSRNSITFRAQGEDPSIAQMYIDGEAVLYDYTPGLYSYAGLRLLSGRLASFPLVEVANVYVNDVRWNDDTKEKSSTREESSMRDTYRARQMVCAKLVVKIRERLAKEQISLKERIALESMKTALELEGYDIKNALKTPVNTEKVEQEVTSKVGYRHRAQVGIFDETKISLTPLNRKETQEYNDFWSGVNASMKKLNLAKEAGSFVEGIADSNNVYQVGVTRKLAISYIEAKLPVGIKGRREEIGRFLGHVESYRRKVASRKRLEDRQRLASSVKQIPDYSLFL